MILQLGTWDFEGSPSHLAIAGMYWTYSLLGVQKLGYFEAFGKSLYMTVAKKKLFFWYGETSLKPYEAQHFLMVNSPFFLHRKRHALRRFTAESVRGSLERRSSLEGQAGQASFELGEPWW